MAQLLSIVLIVFASCLQISKSEIEVTEVINKDEPGTYSFYDGSSIKFAIGAFNGSTLTGLDCVSRAENIVSVSPVEKNETSAIFKVTSKRIGNAYIDCNTPADADGLELQVSVLLEPNWIDPYFSYIGMTVMILLNVLFGTEISLRDIRFILMRPKPLIAAALCQFVLLPPYGLGVSKLLGFEPDVALGVLMVACAPGGGISNTASFLVAGEVPLSISMSFFSTALAAGTMPLNLFIYSRFISDDPSFSASNIPYSTLIVSLATIALPVCLGMFLMAKATHTTMKAKRFAKPFVMLMLLVYIALALYKSSFAFTLFSAKDILGGFLLPLGGFIIGALAALVIRLRFSQMKTIALEVGMQNTLIVVTMVNMVFAPPQSNLNSLMPISIAIMTFIALIPLCSVHFLVHRFSGDYREVCEGNKEEQLRERQRFEGVGDTIKRRLSSVVLAGSPLDNKQTSAAPAAQLTTIKDIEDEEDEIDREKSVRI